MTSADEDGRILICGSKHDSGSSAVQSDLPGKRGTEDEQGGENGESGGQNLRFIMLNAAKHFVEVRICSHQWFLN